MAGMYFGLVNIGLDLSPIADGLFWTLVSSIIGQLNWINRSARSSTNILNWSG